ncbi:unannotated protein [freshwater metagenome]|uniref:Unannotated protein n=1 Tax=freshwater metagenome TaxID=449393 RepID=A0A6J6FK32_9ZZZZ
MITEFATKYKTRWLIVSVLPDPAPAITTAGASGDSIIGICSFVGTLNVGSTSLIRLAMSRAEYLILIYQSPPDLAVGLDKML